MWPSITSVSHDKQVIAVIFECIRILVHLDIKAWGGVSEPPRISDHHGGKDAQHQCVRCG